MSTSHQRILCWRSFSVTPPPNCLPFIFNPGALTVQVWCLFRRSARSCAKKRDNRNQMWGQPLPLLSSLPSGKFPSSFIIILHPPNLPSNYYVGLLWCHLVSILVKEAPCHQSGPKPTTGLDCCGSGCFPNGPIWQSDKHLGTLGVEEGQRASVLACVARG